MSPVTPRENSEPVVIIMSALTFFQVVFAGAGLSDIVGAKVVFLGMLLTGAATAALQFWIRGMVVHTDNVVAYVAPNGTVVAGGALLNAAPDEPVVFTAEPAAG